MPFTLFLLVLLCVSFFSSLAFVLPFYLYLVKIVFLNIFQPFTTFFHFLPFLTFVSMFHFETFYPTLLRLLFYPFCSHSFILDVLLLFTLLFTLTFLTFALTLFLPLLSFFLPLGILFLPVVNLSGILLRWSKNWADNAQR